jgi:hypothetical protein
MQIAASRACSNRRDPRPLNHSQLTDESSFPTKSGDCIYLFWTCFSVRNTVYIEIWGSKQRDRYEQKATKQRIPRTCRHIMARFCEGQVPESRQLDRNLDGIPYSIQILISFATRVLVCLFAGKRTELRHFMQE